MIKIMKYDNNTSIYVQYDFKKRKKKKIIIYKNTFINTLICLK